MRVYIFAAVLSVFAVAVIVAAVNEALPRYQISASSQWTAWIVDVRTGRAFYCVARAPDRNQSITLEEANEKLNGVQFAGCQRRTSWLP